MKQNDKIKQTEELEEINSETKEDSEVQVDEEKTEESEEQKIIATLTGENNKLKDQLLRLAAELDNYRKRRDRDMINLINNANADLILRLLPILDDLERMLDATANGVDADALLDGMKLLYKNLLKTLQDEGLQPMQSVGQPFDPEKHDALLHVKNDNENENTVLDEHKKGYLFKDRVLRHAHVVVSKK